MLGSECFVLNSHDLAAILAVDFPGDFDTLRDTLPLYTIVQVISGLNRLPEERLAYEEEALLETGRQFHFDAQRTVAGIPGLDAAILGLIRKPWQKDVYWKEQPKGACHDIFFHTTLNRVPEFVALMEGMAAAAGYRTRDMGVYLQPLERARACFVCFGLTCNPDNAAEVAIVKNLFLEGSRRIQNLGGFFTTPYGPWADMVYSQTAQYTAVLKIVKNAYDPNNIMNPGKLCF